AVPGILNISSVPDNASVVINGNYKGRAPLSVPGLAPGTYLVNVSRFNYEPLTITATVEQGATTEVAAPLRPKTGTLIINTTTTGEQIAIDGTDRRLSPGTQCGMSDASDTRNGALEGYGPVEPIVTGVAIQSH